jgi:methionyl aminopeptidase
MAIQVKTLDQLKTMRRAGLVVAEIHKAIREAIKPGMTTSALDTIAEAVIKRNGATSNFKGYHGFPATICVSVNDEIVHGIPGDRVINDGDVVSIDCGAIIEGWHGDAAFSIGIGAVDPEDQKLMDVCEESMWRGIAAGKNGARLSDISFAIEQYTNSQGKYGILQEYGGHGIGTEMHQEPHVLNFGKAGNGPEIIARLLQRAEIEKRVDDKEDVIKRRLEVYAEQTAPIISFYRNEGLLISVSAVGSVEDITASAISALSRVAQ